MKDRLADGLSTQEPDHWKKLETNLITYAEQLGDELITRSNSKDLQPQSYLNKLREIAPITTGILGITVVQIWNFVSKGDQVMEYAPYYAIIGGVVGVFIGTVVNSRDYPDLKHKPLDEK